MNKIKITIIGGGFGGIYTAKRLNKLFKEKAEITIINRNNYFLFTPLLHEVATGALTPQSITESIREIFRGTPVNIVEDTAIEIDTVNKIIKTNSKSINYDYLVLSPGAETNYFGIEGAKENTLTLKNLNDAIILRNHIIDTIEKAAENKDTNLLSFTVIGAGATGVELVAELQEYTSLILHSYYKNSNYSKSDIKISIVTNTADLIAQFPIKMRTVAMSRLKRKNINVITNALVTKIDKNLIEFADGKKLNTGTIIWVAGVKPSLSTIKGIEVGAKGRLEVNEYLQSNKNSEIFGLGDSSGTYPMLAQIAVQQAKNVADNIYALVNKRKLIKFKTNIRGLLISLGHWSAAGQFYGMTIYGVIMWLIWRTTYLFNFHSLKKRVEIMAGWTVNIFYPRDITYLK